LFSSTVPVHLHLTPPHSSRIASETHSMRMAPTVYYQNT
jgi:hypothetical protein